MTRIIGFETYDLRFPTSETRDGSDAMNPDPDYSAAYVVLHTDQDGLEGHGMTFTIGRGNEICIAAIEALAPRAAGLELDWIKEDAGRFWRHLTGDSQLRWIGPEKGAIHMGTAAIVNAVWDLWAKSEQKPVWRLVADMTPEQLIRVMEFRYITDCIRPEEALEFLKDAACGKAERTSTLLAKGYPCYTTSAGWLGYDDDKLRRLIKESLAEGFRFLKFKVGGSIEDDTRRLKIAREIAGAECRLMIDANQVWEVSEAIDWVKQLAFAKPWFIEEPTSPDDVEGHRAIREGVAPVRVATGEMCQNRVMFKQFIMRNAIDIVQVDACRLGGINEVLTVLLMAAKHKKPVWPHAGGVGLCEYVQHISFGRRRVWMICLSLAAIFTGLTFFVQNFAELAIIRALASGMAFSELAVSITIVNEQVPANKRGLLYSVVQGGWPLGVFLAAGVDLLFGHLGWRFVFLLGVIPIVLVIAGRSFIKESERFEHLQKVRHAHRAGDQAELTPLLREHNVEVTELDRVTIAQLFATPGYVRRQVITLTLVWLFYSISYVATNFYITYWLTKFKGFSSTEASTLLLVSGGIGFFFYILGGWLGEIFGRRRVMIASGILIAPLNFIFLYLDNFTAVCIIYFLIYQATNGTWSGAGYAYQGESFPTRVRGTAVGFLSAMQVFGFLIGTLLWTFLIGITTPSITWWIIAIGFALGIWTTLLLKHIPPGQELERIAT